MHWADVIAKKVLEKHPEGNVVATGITPSGEIHVGNMREILTGDIITRALKDGGDEKANLIYIGDSFDPLRKVYPFLDPSYKQHVGKPLSEIPCPCTEHENYAEHFLEPFLESLKELGVEQKTLLTHKLYKEGRYAQGTKRVLENREKIRKILEKISGRELPRDWFPYNPKCGACGKFVAKVLSFRHPFVEYICQCGHKGKADIRKDEGKLPWRVDWPVRWWFLGVTVEPFGKDHGAAGGSYDTASAIVKEIFKRDPPPRHVYEWIQLKGKGAMSSSKGIVVSAREMLSITPPEVMRYLIASTNISKHIEFDPGLGILNLVDEFQRLEKGYFEDSLTVDQERTYEFSSPTYLHRDTTHLSLKDMKTEKDFKKVEKRPIEKVTISLNIPYRHLVTVYQVGGSFEKALSILLRTEKKESFSKEEREHLLHRLRCVKNWLERFAPEDVKFSVAKEPPEIEIEEDGRLFLHILFERFKNIPWTGEEIHKAIYHSAQEAYKPRKGFALLYTIFLNQPKGPRLGYFLSSLEKEFVLARVEHYLKG